MPCVRRVSGGMASYHCPIFQLRFELSKSARTWNRLSTVRSRSSIFPPPSMLDCPKQRNTQKFGSGSENAAAATETRGSRKHNKRRIDRMVDPSTRPQSWPRTPVNQLELVFEERL